jgi:argininosuccinate synthase
MKAKDLQGQTIAFAGSGGLDSCTVTRWLTNQGVRVVSMTVDLGQPDDPDLEQVRQRMLQAGAVEALVLDGREYLAEEGLLVIQAQARYEGGYWNTTGIARYVTTDLILREMRQRRIEIFSHGATGRGNDQVRFEVAANMLEPEIRIYAPWRDDDFLKLFGGRAEMIDYCQANGVEVRHSHRKPYSTDANFLGLTHEAGKLESTEVGAWDVTPEFGVLPTAAPDKAETVVMRFEAGRPVSINGEELKLVDVFARVNEIAGRHGVGICRHVVENRFVGIKSRGIYEAPGMELLGAGYDYLLQLLLDHRAQKLFRQLSDFLAIQIYQGYWLDLASDAARGAIDHFSQLATGTIALDCYKGHAVFRAATDCPRSIYSETVASMEKVGEFDHTDSEGFLNILKISARILAKTGQIRPRF